MSLSLLTDDTKHHIGPKHNFDKILIDILIIFSIWELRNAYDLIHLILSVVGIVVIAHFTQEEIEAQRGQKISQGHKSVKTRDWLIDYKMWA